MSAVAPLYISFGGWLGQAGLRACADSRHQTTLLQLPVSASVCRSASPVLTAGLVVLNVIGVGGMHITGTESLVTTRQPSQGLMPHASNDFVPNPHPTGPLRGA